MSRKRKPLTAEQRAKKNAAERARSRRQGLAAKSDPMLADARRAYRRVQRVKPRALAVRKAYMDKWLRTPKGIAYLERCKAAHLVRNVKPEVAERRRAANRVRLRRAYARKKLLRQLVAWNLRGAA